MDQVIDKFENLTVTVLKEEEREAELSALTAGEEAPIISLH